MASSPEMIPACRTIISSAVLCFCLSSFLVTKNRAYSGEETSVPRPVFDKKARDAIDIFIREVGNIKGDDAVALQDAAFSERLKTLLDSPLSAFWAQRLFYLNVLRPRIRDAGPERADAFLRRFAEWAGKTSPEGKARFAAFQIAQFPPTDWPDGLTNRFPALDEIVWEDFDQDYFRALVVGQKNVMERGGGEAWSPWIARWRRLEERLDVCPSALPPLLDGLGYLWGRPLPDAGAKTEEALSSLMEITLRTLSRPLPNLDVWRRFASLIVNRLVLLKDRTRLAYALEELARQQPSSPWIPFWRAELTQLEPASVERNNRASRLRAEAALASLRLAPESAFDFGQPAMSALLADCQSALAEERWEDMLVFARIRFNLSRDERQAQVALDMAGQALVGIEGHWASARRLLGFAQESDGGESEPLGYWTTIDANDVWREVFLSLRKEPFSVQGEVIRLRILACLAVNEGDEAVSLAAKAFRLPELDVRTQTRTMELLAMTLRAKTGMVTGADAFIASQQDSSVVESEDAMAIPPPAKRPETEQGKTAAWAALMKTLADDPAGRDVPRAMRDYAAWLAAGGDLDGALAVMRALLAWALTPAEFTLATQGVASAWKARTGRLAVANQYLLFQRHGPFGPDGEPGTEDDLTDPLTGIAWRMPSEWTKALSAMAKEARDDGRDVAALRLTLLSGDTAAIREEMQRQRRLVPFNEAGWRAHMTWAPMVRKAWLGHSFVGNDYADFLHYGPNGPDGKPGTADDLTDPYSVNP